MESGLSSRGSWLLACAVFCRTNFAWPSQKATLTQLTTQRDSLSAVSLDTEAANLSQYQRSYQAAAQLLTVLDRLMATAMNLGTQTAVS